MTAVLPLWIVVILMVQSAAVSAIVTATWLTQRRLNQDEWLLERLILGTADEPDVRRPGWRRRLR